MKKFSLLAFFILSFTFLISGTIFSQTTVFYQGFEGSWKSMKNTSGITIPSGTPANQGWSTMYSTTDSNNVIHRSDYQGAWSSNRDNCGGMYMPSSCAANSTTYSAIYNNADASGGAGIKSPTINLSAYSNGCSTVTLKFYYLNRNSNSATMNYELYYNGSWHNIQSYGGLGTSSTWTLVTYNIPTSQLTSDFRIEFYCNGNSNGYPIGVDEVSITATVNMSASITASTNVSCNGGSNGTATVTATGGSTPYTYNWSNGRTTSSVTGLSAGTYTATVTGSTGCTAKATVTITQPTALTANAGSNKTICIGSSATLGGSPTASGGTTPYTYSWSPLTALNNTTSANPVSSSTVTRTYTVTVTDSKGCTASSSVVVTVPTPTPVISASPSFTICNGQNTTLTASGGSTYSWNTGATTASIIVSPTTTTAYSVAITSNGCVAVGTKTITVIPAISLGAGNNCSSNITSADNVIWYQFQADSQKVQVRIPYNGTTLYDGTLQLYGGSCGSLSLIATEAFQQDVNNLTAYDNTALQQGSMYWIKISLNSGTFANFSICVSNLSNSSCTSPSCNYIGDGSFELGGTPNFSGQINTSSCWQKETCCTNNCGAPNNTFNTPDLFVAGVANSIHNTNCFDGNNDVGVPTNFITNNAPSANGNRYIGLFHDEKISGNLSTLSQTVYILQCLSHLGDCGSVNSICFELLQGTSSSYSIGTMPLNYSNSSGWSKETMCVDLSATSNLGSYNRFAIRAGSGTDRSLFDDFVMWNMADAGPDVTTCACATIGSNCSTTFANMSYSWSPASGLSNPNILNPVACPSVTTTYTLTATHTDPNTSSTCVATDVVTVTQLGPPPAITISGTSSLCSAATTTLTASGGTSYTWVPGGQTTSAIIVSPTTAACYTVIGSNANGCTSTAVTCITTDCPDFLYEDCRIRLDVAVFATYSITKFGFVITEYPSSSNGTCSGSPGQSLDYNTFGTFAVSGTNPVNDPVLNLPPGHQSIDLTTDFGMNSTTAIWLPPLATSSDYSFQLWDCSNLNPANWFQVGSNDCILTPPTFPCHTVVATRTVEQNPSRIEEATFAFSFYPNPVKNNITISYSLGQEGVFEGFDVFGKLCIMRNLPLGKERRMEIDVPTLGDGIYYCRIRSGTSISKVEKLLIAR